MILDTTLKLEIVLTAAKTANDMDVTVDYFDWNKSGDPTPPASYRTSSNGTTDVTILAAPPFNPVREPTRIAIYNKDTASKVVIVKTDNGTTETIEARVTVPTLNTLVWEKLSGWQLIK